MQPVQWRDVKILESAVQCRHARLPFPSRWIAPLFGLILSSACYAPIARLNPPAPGEPTKPVWIVGHRLHTGIVVRPADVLVLIWPGSGDFSGSTFLEVGWGDRDYYQAQRVTVGLALQAIFRSRGSVLHVVGFDAWVEEFFPDTDIVQLELPERAFEDLTRFIGASYARDAVGGSIRLGSGAYPQSFFYLAEGTYRLFNNCNHWAARALHAAG
jgi:uncharacterized protein (TIGR02117 family)